MSQFLLADGAGYKRVARPVLASDHRKATTSLARAAASIFDRYSSGYAAGHYVRGHCLKDGHLNG
jgi:hypothetical protein